MPVTPGMTGEMDVEITAGLDDEAEVITGPFRALRELKDGDRVRVEEPKGPGGNGDGGERRGG